MALPPLGPVAVDERLGFARRRMDELLALNGGNLSGANTSERQQLVQEFFFHLVGAIELVAQIANERRSLGLAFDEVSIPKVRAKLLGDPAEPLLDDLYARVRSRPLPADPYSDGGYMFRIWNYRHQVTHRRANPFAFALELGSTVHVGRMPRRRRQLLQRLTQWRRPDPLQTASSHLVLDPRNPGNAFAEHRVDEELRTMLQLVERRTGTALAVL